MQIQFIGAAHEVTGSCTLLETGGRKYLVDCGMEQGIDVFENVPIPVPATEIEAVFLTHAHIDHSGMLPKLYKDGFRGLIYATQETCNLCNIMLKDSAHIQMSEAQWRNRKAQRSGGAPVEPIYNLEDTLGTLSQFRPCRYGEVLRVAEGMEVRFTDVGHLLGSACIELWVTEAQEKRKIVFSGDVGNLNQPIINDPQFVEDTDYLVIESTYGNRNHNKAPKGDAVVQLASYIQQALDQGGDVVIPSFAVGRTQEMLYAIRQIKLQGLITGHDGFPVYVDSPLAVEATGIFLQCDLSCLDAPTMELVRQGINPIWFEGLELSVTAEDSKAINKDERPKVILSASGMCEAGRIRHHLKHNLWRPESIILFVGYQSPNSLGRKLQEGAKKVKLFGEEIVVRAGIGTLHGTSGHADQAGLLRWLDGFQEKPKTVYINHGDDDSVQAFQAILTEKGYHAEAPYSGTSYDLLSNEIVVCTESKPIRKVSAQRVNAVYEALVSAAEELLTLVKNRRSCSNQDNTKLTTQIRNLIQKWK